MLIQLAAVDPGRPSRRPSRFWAPRAAAVARLRNALSHDIVVLRGPAGVGKSALLRLLAADIADDASESQVIQLVGVDGERAARVADALRDAPGRHVVIIDDFDDRAGVDSEALLDLMREHSDLSVVVATRYVTRLENPLVALDFDVSVVSRADLLLTQGDVADVLERHGVDAADDAIVALTELSHGWPAIVQLASAHLRLNELPLRTSDDAVEVADYACSAFVADLQRRVRLPLTDQVRLLSIAPYVSPAIADAMGVEGTGGTPERLVRDLMDGGFLWANPARPLLAAPVRAHWFAEIHDRRPDLVDAAQALLLEHFVVTGDPLLAARLAADVEQWSTLTAILRSAGSQIWAQDAEVFVELVGRLRDAGSTDPVVLETMLALDPRTSGSAESATWAAQAVSRLPEARVAAVEDLERLVARVHLLRAAGRFALASEAAATLADALRKRDDVWDHVEAEGWYQVGMTHLAMGQLREASLAFGVPARALDPGRWVRAEACRAIVALLDGDVTGAADIVAAAAQDRWARSPWAAGLQIAEAWLDFERGHPEDAIVRLTEGSSSPHARELWPYAATVHTLSVLVTGSAADGLGTLRMWSARSHSVPVPHFAASQMTTARAKVLITLRQARRAMTLFDGPFQLTSATSSSMAMAQFYAGHIHEAYVTSMKWGTGHGASPRTALENLVVNIAADVRLNGSAIDLTNVRRAEALSVRHGLWSPWSAVALEDRDAVFELLSADARAEATRRGSFFASSVSVPRLTKREHVILARLEPASTVGDIARALVVSPNTVKSQLQSLYRKLDVSDRSGAIRAAHAWGFIESDDEL